MGPDLPGRSFRPLSSMSYAASPLKWSENCPDKEDYPDGARVARRRKEIGRSGWAAPTEWSIERLTRRALSTDARPAAAGDVPRLEFPPARSGSHGTGRTGPAQGVPAGRPTGGAGERSGRP